MNRNNAFSLIELMLALAVLATISIFAVPGFSTLLQNIRMSSNVNELIHSLHRARQNARVTGIATVICSSHDGQQCLAHSDWADGWLMFANADGDEPPQVDSGDRILHTAGPAKGLHIFGNRQAFIMRPFGLRSTNGTLVWCDRRGSAHARAVIVSYTGKPRVRDYTGAKCPPADG